VDNFSAFFFFNDFNTQAMKSWKTNIFDHYEFSGTMEFDGDQFKLQWLS